MNSGRNISDETLWVVISIQGICTLHVGRRGKNSM